MYWEKQTAHLATALHHYYNNKAMKKYQEISSQFNGQEMHLLLMQCTCNAIFAGYYEGLETKRDYLPWL